MIADFCLASDTYDSLTEDEQAAVNSGIREALETVRNRIAAQISSVNGVTVTGNPWYVQLLSSVLWQTDYQEKNLPDDSSLPEVPR